MRSKTVQSGHKKLQTGFTLIEMAVVLVVIGIVVGSFIGSFAQRVETSRRDVTKLQLLEIKSALLGFAGAKGRLPCPAQANSNGLEVRIAATGICNAGQHGFIPGRTLGLTGSYNRDSLLTDSWGNPIRYSVTANNNWAFTKDTGTVGDMKSTTMAILDPDLVVCDGDSTAGTSCAGSNTLVDTVPFIVLSLGKDGSDFVGTVAPISDQGENSGEKAVTANAAGENVAYLIANNRVFVNKVYSSVDATAGQFDDLIIWVSPYVLYSRMIEAGQLP